MNQFLEKKYIIIAVVVLVAVVGTTIFLLRSPEDTWMCENGAWVKHGNPKEAQPTTPCGDSGVANNKACTEEAKLCPDGSTVGRTGPNCEFAVCPPVNSIISETEARTIAEKSCIKGGETLASGIYNEKTKTWWYVANLNSVREGCTPACVVDEQTKTAGINWHCLSVK